VSQGSEAQACQPQRPDQPEHEGVAVAKDLMARLGITERQLIETAYIDLAKKVS
jgi:hypothetical protein